ncbi:hypothetical protein EV702DRAFT_1206781 [Suillus placidus]|uniref:Uncharacterized protein n=1 Tax=Suillus placidus TaxID=48579 RepID=A0A9P7CV76_9AGAM|nr:hypothetical protein EV702DRAFT_1206781 [Suillus placidus]
MTFSSPQRIAALILEREFPTAPSIIPPTVTLLVGHLVVDTSQLSHASPDSWFIDHFISDAGRHHTLGVGDHIVVYHHFLPSPTEPALLPAFSGVLTHVTAWSPSAVEFNVRDAHVGGAHPRTIRIPHAAARLSWFRHLQGRLFWPRCFHEISRPPFTLMPKCGFPSIEGRVRVPRDSDDLPRWDLAPAWVHGPSLSP